MIYKAKTLLKLSSSYSLPDYGKSNWTLVRDELTKKTIITPLPPASSGGIFRGQTSYYENCLSILSRVEDFVLKNIYNAKAKNFISFLENLEVIKYADEKGLLGKR